MLWTVSSNTGNFFEGTASPFLFCLRAAWHRTWLAVKVASDHWPLILTVSAGGGRCALWPPYCILSWIFIHSDKAVWPVPLVKREPWLPDFQKPLAYFGSASRQCSVTVPTSAAEFCHLLCLGGCLAQDDRCEWNKWLVRPDVKGPPYFPTLQKQGRIISISDAQWKLLPLLVQLQETFALGGIRTMSACHLQDLSSRHRQENLKILSYFLFSTGIDSSPQWRMF